MIWVTAIIVLLLLGGLVFIFVNPLGNGNVYRPDLEQLDKLRELKLSETVSDKKVFGSASTEKRGGLFLIWLKGKPYEMGFQHGKLLEDAVQGGAMPYHANPVYNHPPFNLSSPLKKWFLSRYFDWTIFRPLLKHAPRSFLEEIKGLADGSGLPFDLVFRGNMLSEFNMTISKLQKKMMLRRLQPVSECSSFAVFDEMTRDGSLIMGRNTDYSGAGLWDITQTIFLYQPQDGYRYVNVGAAGLLKCNSSMNEKGLCLGGHFMYSEDVQPNGVGFTALEIEIMKSAGSISEAFNIVKGHRRAGAFGYMVVDGFKREAAVIEATTGRVGIRMAENGAICETNFMTVHETREMDFLQELSIARNPLSRYRRLEELIHEHAGSITAQKAAHFMGDHKDMTSGAIRPFGNVIATLGNLTSVVFHPEKFIFWVADGLAPVCNNIFIGFNMNKEFEHKTYLVDPKILEPNDFVKTVSYEALRQYYPLRTKAALPPFQKEDLLERMHDMIRLIPGEVTYRMLITKLLLRAGVVDEAIEQLKLMVDLALSPSEQAQVILLLGYAYDLCGEKDEAARCYYDILQRPQSTRLDDLTAINPFILMDAKRFVRTPFSPAQLSLIDVSLDMGSIYDR